MLSVDKISHSEYNSVTYTLLLGIGFNLDDPLSKKLFYGFSANFLYLCTTVTQTAAYEPDITFRR